MDAAPHVERKSYVDNTPRSAGPGGQLAMDSARSRIRIDNEPPPAGRTRRRPGRTGPYDDWEHDMFDGSSGSASSSVFIRNMPKNVSQEQVRALFSSQGLPV